MTATSLRIGTKVLKILNSSKLENSNNASVASMNAGGSSANHFDVLEAWYPVTSIASLTFLVIGLTWYRLGKLEQQFYQGCLTPPRNLPEKPKK